MKEFIIAIKPLTSIWTGDANKKNITLRETGIIGSLRWWYEILIRGLGGTACDPSKTNCNEKNHCDACELFGCNGWSRKFRLIIEEKSQIILKFIIFRKINEIELTLINRTIQIIENYGSLGSRIAKYNGLIEVKRNDFSEYNSNINQIREYLTRKGSYVENPNFTRFIFMVQNLQYPIIKELKNKFNYLKGSENRGKRYFYKTYKERPYRFFTYAENSNEYEEIKSFLKNKNANFIEGIKMIEEFK